jgi:putative membrane-bound dehydrogenase-like protein
MKISRPWIAASLAISALFSSQSRAQDVGGVPPTDSTGKPLNFDFEGGTLKDWKAVGPAFADSVVEGDAIFKRRSDMKSQHQGKYWVGSFEKGGDAPQGSLTSVAFVVTKPWASFLIAGGAYPETRVEFVRVDTGEVIAKAHGDDTETMKRVAVDLSKHKNAQIFVRLIDQHSGGWGHINFDDLRLHDQRPNIPMGTQTSSPDTYAHSGLSPIDAAKAMTLPEGFKVELVAGEPDVVQPIALAIDDKGRLWVAEAYSYPHRLAPDKAHDRILIFEDKDGDGKFETRKVFVDNLNLVSGIEVGFGGVWVGAAPEFLFIPDKNGDDKPDGPPQVLLNGWGQHDTHETLNSFAWGPDGWLYGCHGVFTFSNVGKPGTPEKDRTPINAGIWRYHPTKHLFEVFANGTSNPWGVDWDAHGQSFLTSCVIPHLYHVIQGGRYERQGGTHYNPYTYDDIKTIADHRHYVGANPHGGNGRSDSMGGGHAHCGAMIYQGDQWPEEYRGSIFMNNIHGARLNRDTFAPQGSGFIGSHAKDFLFANDTWSQIVSLKQGPDGSMFMIDWYDKNQCHRNENEAHDRTNGRIFKVSYQKPNGAKVGSAIDVKSLDDHELMNATMSSNEWLSRHARRVLQERGESTRVAILLKILIDPNAGKELRVRALWALHAVGKLDEVQIKEALADKDPYLRAWTIQLAMEDKKPSAATLAKFAEMAKSDSSLIVRLYLASACQRLEPAKTWDIVAGLVSHEEDITDPNLPFMVWYAAEPLAPLDPAKAMSLALSSKLPTLLPFMTRRVAAIGSDEAIAMLVGFLSEVKQSAQKLAVLDGIDEALKGRRQAAMPKAWPAIYKALAADKNPALKARASSLGVTFGDEGALSELRKVLDNDKEATARRLAAMTTLLKVRDKELPSRLLAFVAVPSMVKRGGDGGGTIKTLSEAQASLRSPAIRGLAAYDFPAASAVLVQLYSDFSALDKRDALNTLAARPESAKILLDAVGAKRIASTELSADLIRQLRNLKDKSIDEQIGKVWGTVRETSPDRTKVIARYKSMIRAGYTDGPDIMLGRAVYTKTCAQCHTLFATGGKVGPELTGSNRADLDYLLSNVLDPNALIGKDYVAHVIATKDGRTLTGLIRSEDKDSITLATANETVTIPKAEIEERKPSDKSMMPEDIWTPLSDHDIKSLVAYLASPNQVPILANPELAATFFNGRDLTGWQGDSTLWSVENGEIVGKTKGLAKNEFLRSDLAAADFHLTVQVKLVKNEGNSGIQFRSVALPDGEMKGDQADVGAGWWGKLYEENGRGLLWKDSGEAHVKLGEWNTYEVIANGSKIVTKINGKLCVDLDDPAGAKRGIFAFQLHSGGATEVRFKDIKLEVGPLGH